MSRCHLLVMRYKIFMRLDMIFRVFRVYCILRIWGLSIGARLPNSKGSVWILKKDSHLYL